VRGFIYRTFATCRTLESIANLCWIEIEFRDGAAKSVAVHAQFPGRLALVSSVMRQHFQDEALLELTHCLVIGDTPGMHLCHKAVQFTFHRNLFLDFSRLSPGYYGASRLRLPLRVSVVQLSYTFPNLSAQFRRHVRPLMCCR
jgi:hypothetical protein